MDVHQRRIKRRRLLRGDGIDKFLEWIKGGDNGDGPVFYALHEKSPEGGNRRYWEVTARTPASQFTRATVLRLLGCG